MDRRAGLCASALMQMVGADSCLLVRLKHKGTMAACLGWTVEGDVIRHPEERLSHFLIRRVEQSGAPLFVPDAREDRRWRSVRDQRLRRHIRSLLGLPVFAGPGLEAVVCLSHDNVPLVYQADDLWVAVLVTLLTWALSEDRTGPPIRSDSLADTQAAVLAASEPPSKNDDAARAVQPDLSSPVMTWQGFCTRSAAMKRVFESAEQLAPTDLPVLIVGEDGVGKDTLARAIHALSGLSGSFVPVSCSTIPEHLAASELFGHSKGAFTGAVSDREGLVVEARDGTLFLDDIQELKPSLQATLLRVLAEGKVRPLGAGASRPVTFRLVTSSALALAELKRAGFIRNDFLYRIQGSVLSIPPLRERQEDIRMLFDHYYGASGEDRPCGLTADAEQALYRHPWPGNVRELRNEARRLKALGMSDVDVADFSFGLAHADDTVQPVPGSRCLSLKEAVAQAEKACVVKALTICDGNKSRAAKLLCITRRSLYRRIDSFNL